MATNSEGNEREGQNRARDARGRFTLAQGKLFYRSGGRWLCELCVVLGIVMGSPVLFGKVCQVAEVVVRLEGTAS